MRLVDADELLEHAYKDKLDSRELIAEMIISAPTVKEIPTTIPLDIFEQLLSNGKHNNSEIIQALEDIRAEIEADRLNSCRTDFGEGVQYELTKVVEIIDNKIAEVRKNENKER